MTAGHTAQARAYREDAQPDVALSATPPTSGAIGPFRNKVIDMVAPAGSRRYPGSQSNSATAKSDAAANKCGLTPAIADELVVAGFDDAREVGVGGFGAVYRCWQRSLERTVAIKVLTTELDAENLERFLREQRAMGKLGEHPNIVNVFEVGATGSGRPFIVMPYHPHNSLQTRIHRTGPLSWEEAVHIGVKIAGALETAHRLGTLHRDVKPANILLTAYGEPQLTDFGIARTAGGFQTATGVLTASPGFSAPEILQGQPPTPSCDVYSLGATLFCALTGHAAFERRSGEHLLTQFVRMTSEAAPPLPHHVPNDMRVAIERAMAGILDGRPVTAAEFGDELRAAQRGNGLAVDDMAVPDHNDCQSGRRSGPVPAQHHRPAVTPLRVVVAEDDVLLREGLASLLDRSGFAVVGQAGSGVELLAMVRDLEPELVVTDIRMPPTHSTEGLDVAQLIREELPATAIVVLSAHIDVEHAMELLASGRSIGYLLKSRVIDVAEFIDIVERIAKGASVVDPALVTELVSARRSNDPLAVLSTREREVLALMAEGRSNAGIAHRIWVSEGTVEKHVRSIMRKLDLPETGDDHRRVLAAITFLEAH